MTGVRIGEPFLTVYGEVDESLEIKEDVKKLERRILDLNRTIDEKFNKLLDSIVESGLFHSKAELVRSATIHFLLQMDVLKDFLKESQ